MATDKPVQQVPEGTPVTIATMVQSPAPIPKDPTLNLATVGIYISIIVGALAIAGWILRWIGDRRKEDREWMTGKLETIVDKLNDDIKETRTDVKETQRRLHDVEQQRSTDREKIIVLEKDISHFKDSQTRMEKQLEKIGEEQKTYFGEIAKSIRQILEVRPAGK
ncbi:MULTISPECIES: hypothetical protein [Sphingobium]|uniref:hypothetical protein n=1 Tax=Sphingobium TaxID=165695 RepID=UPI00037A091C|nr:MULTISPECIES: hypothetical protein [Sphingobium]EXS68277.1 hypothetical protein BF95_11805 [Sphingobium sp. Ant17]